MRIGIWIQALRLPFLTASIIPLLLGTVIAWREHGAFDPRAMFAAFLGVSLIHLAANLSNDYFDYFSGNDLVNRDFNEFSGGSRAIADGGITPRAAGTAALLLYAAGTCIGLALAWRNANAPLAGLFLLGTFAGYAYTGIPFRLGYRGLGEMLNGCVFGPLLVMIAYEAQVPAFSVAAAAASVLPGLLLAILLLINEFPDHDADAASQKRTLVVRLGKPRALRLYHGALAGVYLYLLAALGTGLIPLLSALALLSLPFAVAAARAAVAHPGEGSRPALANLRTFQLHGVFGLLLCAGFLLHGGV